LTQDRAPELVCLLPYRPPYAQSALLSFLAERHLPGVEFVDPNPSAKVHWARSVALASPDGVLTGWVRVRFDADQHRLRVGVARSLQACLPALQAQLAAVFDLGAPALLIGKALAQAPFAVPQGLRVPGALDPFELLVRAILGQQVSVAVGTTLLERFSRAFGQAVSTPIKGIDWRFPLPNELLARGEGLDSEMGALGIIKMRQQAIRAGAQALLEGALDLQPGASSPLALQALLALPGIGPWTAHYIVMRSLKWPDAWMPGDVAVHQAMGLLATQPRAPLAQRIQLAQDMSRGWQPWRSYGVMAAWHSLKRLSEPHEENR
jgi:AraC family transcriptional regulator of adaptative response / DNA-3-methyladenine glycosylase II